MKIPKRLGINPIVDAIAELRFTSKIPGDAIIGLVYATLEDTFGKPENLPILQLPSALREKDPNLRYQACYKFTKPGNVLLVGPRTVALSTYPYSDWGGASPLILDVLSRLNGVKLFDQIERIGLRYVNFFENLNICEHSTLRLDVREVSVLKQNLSLRTETESRGFKVITQVANRAQVQIAGQMKDGSVLDLDVIKDKLELPFIRPEEFMSLFLNANVIADETFFNFLADDFIQSFKPEY